MTFWHVVSAVAGVVLVAAVLASALETVVLPHQGFTRITQMVFAVVHRLMVHRWGFPAIRRRQERLFGPAALVSLPLVWMVSVTIGFALIFWGLSVGSVSAAVKASGSSLFTLGFSEPTRTGLVWLTFVEATIGLGLVALLISYLPTIYTGYNQREKGVNVLRPFAGSPPSGVQLLSHLHRVNSLGTPSVWTRAVDWLVDLEMSHGSFPALCYFPMQDETRSWVASAGALLDAAALLVSARGVFDDESKGAVLALVYGPGALRHIARSAGIALAPSPPFAELLTGAPADRPPISVTRAEYEGCLQELTQAGVVSVPADDEAAWARFAAVRASYDAAVCSLAGLTGAPRAPLTTDRPATVGRPRLLIRNPLRVQWPGG